MTGTAAPGPQPFALPVDEVLRQQGVAVAQGLSEDEAARRLAQAGPNEIGGRQRAGLLTLLLHQVRSPVVLLLAAAAVLSLWFGEIEQAVAIAVVLAINTLIGFITEYRAVRSIDALRRLESRMARVRRDGHERVVPSRELVPGDIVLLDAGDAAPADLRVVDCAGLHVDESTLTGESVAVSKTAEPMPPDARLGDRRSMVYLGTAATRGTASGVVVATGAGTELGQLSELVAEAGEGPSPIERKLARLSAQLVWITIGLSAGMVALAIARGEDILLMAEAGIALAVAAIPEGLPIVATLTLARGMWRMAGQNALVERLSAVETLGATTVILTDKTGTLTENRMTVRRFGLPSADIASGEAATGAAGPELDALLEVAVLCNDAALEAGDETGVGDPMELALLRAGLDRGVGRTEALAAAPMVAKHAFDSRTKMMATVHRRDGGCFLAVKGAPERVLEVCTAVADGAGVHPMGPEDRAAWLERVDSFGQLGLRVVACATRRVSGAGDAPYEALVLLGLIGLEDPAREDVGDAIAACLNAGIRVVMVTGDHAATARSIGRAVGLEEAGRRVAEGHEVAGLAGAGGPSLSDVGIFARVTPKEKLELVEAYQRAGHVVAMTGDGVNDAPALRQADIGVAMGLRGTDVAKEAAAMILLDDAFPTLVAAIREGRVIFANIRRFASYLLACNLAEVLVVGLAVLSGLPLPLLPLQILYLNLITDVFPAFALALGDGEDDVLDRPPRDPRQSILGRPQWIRIGLQSVLMAGATFAALFVARDVFGLDQRTTVTATFLALAFAQLWMVFAMRADRAGVIRNEITRNPWIWAALALCSALLVLPAVLPPLGRVLDLTPPDARLWATVLALSAAPALVWLAFAPLRRRMRG